MAQGQGSWGLQTLYAPVFLGFLGILGFLPVFMIPRSTEGVLLQKNGGS
jgi:hypothetical protein